MAKRFVVPIVAQREVAEDHFELELVRPDELGEPVPGQFVGVLCRDGEGYDPLLRRPFSLYRVEADTFSILYRASGRGTRILTRARAGDKVDVLGPLGSGFDLSAAEAGGRAILVGGGVGVPPIFHLSQALGQRGVTVDVCVGFASARRAFGLADWRRLGVEPQVATDDGSLGRRGYVTELLEEALGRGPAPVFACGPRPMLAAVARLAQGAGAPVQVAMEEWMGCGVGACLSCVCLVRSEHGTRWARVCREGPVFDGSKVVWSDGQ